MGVGTGADAVQSKLAGLFPDFTLATRTAGEYQPPPPDQKVYEIVCSGPDQPGVVRRLSGLFKEFSCNIRDMSTDTSSAPFAGYRIFSVKAQVAAPQHFDLKKFEGGLRDLEDSIGVEITVAHANE